MLGPMRFRADNTHKYDSVAKWPLHSQFLPGVHLESILSRKMTISQKLELHLTSPVQYCFSLWTAKRRLHFMLFNPRFIYIWTDRHREWPSSYPDNRHPRAHRSTLAREDTIDHIWLERRRGKLRLLTLSTLLFLTYFLSNISKIS